MERINAIHYLQDLYEALDWEIDALRAALAEPEQEPDGISWLKRDSGYFTAPTPRKPLKEDEIEALWQNTSPYYDHQDFARAVIAA